jgi:DNA-binding GntR family transcriptional regulator
MSAAYRAIRIAIEEGVLAPGERVRMNQLVSELHMSPTPIREALRLLQADGLVEHRPHRGIIVSEYTPERAEEVYRLRVALEPIATELAAQRATDEDLAQLAALHDDLVMAVADGLFETAAALNVEWHRTIYAASGSRYLQEFINRLWAALPLGALWVSRCAQRSIEEHAAIMEALLRHDGKRAASVMTQHLARGNAMTAARLRKHRG